MTDALKIYVDLDAPPDALELLRRGTAGHQLLFSSAPVSVLAAAARDPLLAEAQVAFGQPSPDAVADSPTLKWVHISSSGITRYDNPAFRARMAEKGIAVTNSAGVYNEACAAQAIGFMLAEARQLPAALSTRTPNATPEWNALRAACGTLRGERLLILGYGAIGTRLAELLAPFGMQLAAYRRHARGNETIPVVTQADLPRALGEADHVMNILPESVETRRFFDRSRFAAMKRGSVFYNIGRGATVDQEALRDALCSRHLRSAWLDVTDPEPLPDHHPLWAEPNCHITPHIAGGHAGEAKTLVRHFLRNLEHFTGGQPLLDRVM
jgi:phosphoglycerate dehydrogenase-like enzyme